MFPGAGGLVNTWTAEGAARYQTQLGFTPSEASFLAVVISFLLISIDPRPREPELPAHFCSPHEVSLSLLQRLAVSLSSLYVRIAIYLR